MSVKANLDQFVNDLQYPFSKLPKELQEEVLKHFNGMSDDERLDNIYKLSYALSPILNNKGWRKFANKLYHRLYKLLNESEHSKFQSKVQKRKINIAELGNEKIEGEALLAKSRLT